MNKEVKVIRKKRKINFQKIFNLVSFTFILACCIFYGSRFIKLYLANNKTEEKKVIADNIKENNNDLTNINGAYYFSGENPNNYLEYSNITFRIIKINSDKTITAIVENSITSLAAGNQKQFEDSNINKWLNNQNKEYTGILENNLNNANKYLTYTKTCNDTVNDTKNITCKKNTNNIYITIPSINDYINTGGQKGFMNNEEYFYLINSNNENKTWYVDSDGKVNISDGSDIIGIKPVITIKNTLSLLSGDGSENNPYIFEEEKGLLGSYVKLGNDTWRIYNIDGDNIKLSLNTYLTLNNEEIKYKYSNNGYYHNDGKVGTLAYYLKNKYLPTLSYKDIINEVEYANGIYNNTNNYDYTKVISTTVPTKVSVLSIGDIILNPINTNYYLSTGIENDSSLVYVFQNDFKIYTKVSTTNLKIIPVISIKKDLLTEGNGSIENPWEVSND